MSIIKCNITHCLHCGNLLESSARSYAFKIDYLCRKCRELDINGAFTACGCTTDELGNLYWLYMAFNELCQSISFQFDNDRFTIFDLVNRGSSSLVSNELVMQFLPDIDFTSREEIKKFIIQVQKLRSFR